MKEEENSDISPLIRHWMPNATREAQLIATTNLRALLVEFEQIYNRLEREGRFPLHRDNDDQDDTVEQINTNDL